MVVNRNPLFNGLLSYSILPGRYFCTALFSENITLFFLMILTMNKINFLVLAGFLVGLSVGCSDSKLSTAYVEGVITFNGETVSKATITFSPKDSDGKPAVGYSNDKGVYKLTTHGGKDEGGAIPGEYLVSISKSDVAIVPLDQANYSQQTTQRSTAPGVAPKYDALIPKKYSNTTTSGLTATVAKGKNKQINFELTE